MAGRYKLELQPKETIIKKHMQLLNSQKKRYKSIGHSLKPVVILSENGLSEGVSKELDRALNDHELIKIKVNTEDRESKIVLINEICAQAGATLIQVIGKTALIFRPAQKPNPKLSNILRHQDAI